ncbi:uncharacterized protein N7484_010248 [Penicillium longicatenatum]|uniref:uncharacterized protein n=1 Tax=Penicillium longicatenatum TaxID=1561947 RepID=UPI002546B2E1|nr:uncharacterized protein N7484_010248 [Penicillium longicatenatum]KAJ5636935.1 hypothetical protein N7484_010248 [Penicillium longicatenatum]
MDGLQRFVRTQVAIAQYELQRLFLLDENKERADVVPPLPLHQLTDDPTVLCRTGMGPIPRFSSVRPIVNPPVDRHYTQFVLSLQTWTQSRATQSYWVIPSDHDAPDQVVNDKTPHGTANSNFLHDLRQRESRFQTADQHQNAYAFTGTATYEKTRPWLDRTRWISTYQGIPREILKRMTLLPTISSATHGLQLGGYQNRTFASPAADEEQIYHLIATPDTVLDRCEDTMRHTGQPFLAWLKSHMVAEPSPQPFSFLGTQQSRSRYRRTWKQFIAFVLHAFRLGPVITLEVLRLTLLPQHLPQLEQLWANSFETGSRSSSPRPCFAREIPCLGEQEPDAQGERALSPLFGDEVFSSDSDEDKDLTGRPDAMAQSDELLNCWKPASIGPLETCSRPGSSLLSPRAPSDQLAEALFKLCVLLITQQFKDGQPHSSVLVYFSGVLGISSNGGHFLPAKLRLQGLSR